METASHILFYGSNDSNPYKEFSDFYMCNFIDDNGNLYNCSEQYFMKKKQELFDPANLTTAKSIMESNDPSKIKSFGRKIKNYDDNIWNSTRYNVMYDALKFKFSHNNNLKHILLSTGNKIIVEAAARDKIWGAGMTAQQIINNNYNLKGQNLLGQLLMRVRDEMKA